MNTLPLKRNYYLLVFRHLIVIFGIFSLPAILMAQVAINNTGNPPDASAMLDVSATDKGVLIPRITQANRPAATNTGLMIYQTDGATGFYYANGANWIKVGDAAMDYWVPAVGSDIRFPNDVALGDFTDAEGYGLNVQNYSSNKAAIRGVDQIGTSIYAEGMLGVLDPSGFGLPVSVFNIGVLGIKPNTGSNGAAVYGWNNQSHVSGNYAGLFVADGTGAYYKHGLYSQASGAGNAYGIEARAVGTYANYGIYSFTNNGTINYAGHFKGRVYVEGHNVTTNGADSLSTVLESRVTHNSSVDTRAIYAVSTPKPGYGYGVYASGGYRGIYGVGEGADYSGTVIGVYGYSSGIAGTRYGVYGSAYNTGNTAVGIYGVAGGATNNWAGYFSGSAYVSSDLRIATTTQATGYALSVNGKIACEEVLVELNTNWPDYVFSDDYQLLSLPELEKSIEENGHLPGLPSAQEVKESGFELADMQKRVLEKVEELILYTIEQQKMIDQLRQEVDQLKNTAISGHPLLPFDEKSSPEERAAILSMDFRNPDRISEPLPADPKAPEPLLTSEIWSLAQPDAPPIEAEQREEILPPDSRPTHELQASGTDDGQPEGEAPETILNRRNIQGPQEQPAGERPAGGTVDRKTLQGPAEQPRGNGAGEKTD